MNEPSAVGCRPAGPGEQYRRARQPTGDDTVKTHRLERVAEVVREVASETILFEMRDPRVKNVTVTRAEVAGDLQHAKVYVSIMGSEREQKLCLYGLQRAAGFIQSKLGDRMRSRFVPVLQFVLDKGVKNSIEVTRLINEALGRDKPEESEGDGADREADSVNQSAEGGKP
jgi:ribosome-binding factor A